MRSGWMAFVVVGAVAGQAAFAADYDVDTKQSLLTVRTYKDGVAARLAHDHIVQATEYSGTVSFDPASDTNSISMEAKTASLVVDEGAMRKKMGLEGEPGEGDRKDITKNMQAADQLDTAKYKTISFKSSSIKKQADGTYLVNGKLTLRGKTNDVSFPAKVDMQGDKVHAVGTFKFKGSSYGFEPYSAMFGAVKNKDEYDMRVEIVGTPRPGQAAPAPAPAPAAAPASSGNAPK